MQPSFCGHIWWCDLLKNVLLKRQQFQEGKSVQNEARHVSDCNQNMLSTPQTAGQMALKFVKSGK